MNYKIFGGRTGLRVSEFALGTGNFGTRLGHGAEKQDAQEIFNHYLEVGGNFIDTADTYQLGESEEILGQLMQGHRDELVLASKYSIGGASMASTGNSLKTMLTAIESTLHRLKTDRLDLYWVHLADGQTPTEEILRGMDLLHRSGKILYAGFSNFPAWRVSYASLMAETRGHIPLAAIQLEYNLLERSAERELIPMAEAFDLAAAFWSPLAGGTLTGKYRGNTTDSGANRKQSWAEFLVRQESSDRESRILDETEAIAKELDVSMQEVALAWVRQKNNPGKLATVTILGPRTIKQLRENLAVLPLTLSDEQMSRLTQASEFTRGYPHEVITNTQKAIFGTSANAIQGIRSPR